MRPRSGGQAAAAGFYWSLREWEVVTISGRAGGILPGDGEQTYLKVPVFLMLTLAPLMGGLLVMFLPFVGFALLLAHLGRLAGGWVRRAAARLMAGPGALRSAEDLRGAPSPSDDAPGARPYPNHHPGPPRRAA